MADRIKLLPEVVANQIAAGEVVNRPSSVVKEMMENAIDAGARSVKVNFRDGGKELIQIVDDGCGMSPIDARMAFDRHATSKISSLDDIYALKTFGFRGEALASIAAVSQVELRTRQAEDEVGTLTTVNGGEFVSQTLAACPVGSQFYVRNLFYNVPARRKFLEKSTTSTGQIKSEFQRVALCNPQVGFELLMNDQPLYRLPAASLASRIVDVVGRHIKQNLLEVDADTSIVRVTGFVGRPAAAKKSNSSEQYLFVNGRYFRSPYFFKAILKAYEKLIPDACSPSYFLYLTIDPSRIDVNVHPQKTEVKFADEEAVWQIINAAVRETLAKTGAVPLMDFDQTDSVEIPVLTKGAVYREPKAMSNESYNPFRADYASDVSERMPDVDFSGFDAPYDGEMPAGKGVGRRIDTRDDPFCRVRSDRNGVHSFCRGTGATTADGRSCGLFQRCDGARQRVCLGAVRRQVGGRGPAPGAGTGVVRQLPAAPDQRIVGQPAAPFPGASRVFGKRICVARGECGRFRGVGFRPGVLRRRSRRGKGRSGRHSARYDRPVDLRIAAGVRRACGRSGIAAREDRRCHGLQRSPQHVPYDFDGGGRISAGAALRRRECQLHAFGQGGHGRNHTGRNPQ